MDNYVIWKPEHYGHAPPFWKDGMHRRFRLGEDWRDIQASDSGWHVGNEYRVPPEAVNGPPIDAHRNDAEFDVEAWLEQGRANADKLPDGVVLPEVMDWATKVWRDANEAYDHADENEAAIAVIRTHCQPREVSNG